MPGIMKRPKRWLLRDPSPDAAARLFCLPYSGCGASMYRRWPRLIGDVEVCAVQLPGRENRLREPAHTSYEALAEDLAEALLPHLDRPFGLFGHCGSALAAYETVVRLQHLGYPLPARLFVSSQVAPQDGPYGRFLTMTDAGLLDELGKLVTRLGGTPDPGLLDLSLGVLRADVEANKRYHVPTPTPLSVPITAIGWTGDVEVEHTRMTGWPVCGSTTFALLEGEHYSFTEAPVALLELLSGSLHDGGDPTSAEVM